MSDHQQENINWPAIMANLMERLNHTLSSIPNEARTPSKPCQLNLPQFKGSPTEDVEEWIAKCDKIFTIFAVENSETKAQWMGTALSEVANVWYRGLQLETTKSYEELILSVRKRFGRQKNKLTLRMELVKLKMDHDIADYSQKFQILTSNIPSMHEHDKVFHFIQGLNHVLIREREVNETGVYSLQNLLVNITPLSRDNFV